MEICRLNMEKVIQFDISEKLRQIYQLQIAQSTKSAESALYSGFIPNEDIKTAETVRSASMEDFSKNTEIHFPKTFTSIMKVLKVIPNGLYFKIVEKGMKKIVD